MNEVRERGAKHLVTKHLVTGLRTPETGLSDVHPDVFRRVLLGFSVVSLAFGAFEGWSAAGYVRDLRHVRLHGRAEPRTAQEDYATNSYWLEVGARLNGMLAAAFLASGLGVLWLRSRVRR